MVFYFQVSFHAYKNTYMNTFESEWLCGKKKIWALEWDKTEYKY